jgi:hypothetical protein
MLSRGMKKKAKPFDIFGLTASLDELSTNLRLVAMIDGGIAEGDRHKAMNAIERLAKLEGYETLLAHKRYAGHEMHLRYVRSSIEKGRFGMAVDHLGRLRKVVRVTSNDQPHKVKDKVWVNRYEHGWDVGSGVVVEVMGAPPEIVCYTVEMDTGGTIFVDHTRNLSRSV